MMQRAPRQAGVDKGVPLKRVRQKQSKYLQNFNMIYMRKQKVRMGWNNSWGFRLKQSEGDLMREKYYAQKRKAGRRKREKERQSDENLLWSGNRNG